jgi:cytidine deaminase
MSDAELVNLAKKAKEYAYVPYSHFRVGAAVLTSEGEVFTGCNIENASYGGTVCAERTALFKAISEGKTKINKIAVIGDMEDFTYPCGICRQVIAEYGTDIEVIVAKSNGEYRKHKLSELLPYAFTEKDLEGRKLDG